MLIKLIAMLLLAGFIGHIGLGFGHQWWNASFAQLSATFEEGDLSGLSDRRNKQFCCTHSAVLATDTVKGGKYSLKLTLKHTDALVKGSKRSEVRSGAAQFDKSSWYRFGVFVPDHWTFDETRVTVAQWHAVPDKLYFEKGRPPPLRILIKDDLWYVVSQWDDDRVSRTAIKPFVAQGGEILWKGPLERGEWVSWALHVRWSIARDGKIEVWKNGNRIVSSQGPNAYNDALAPYFKLGIYIPSWSATDEDELGVRSRTLYFDDVWESLNEDRRPAAFLN